MVKHSSQPAVSGQTLPPTFTMNEISAAMKISIPAVSRLAKNPEIEVIRIGRSVRFVADSFLRYLERQRQNAA